MNNIEIYFKQAQLAQAAYADHTGSDIPNTNQLVNFGKMSGQQANTFADQWTVVDQYNDAITNASVTVFEEKATGQRYLAIRGTLEVPDFVDDFLLAVGFSIFLDPQFNVIHSKVTEWLDNGTLSPGFSVIGHSLGGYLAAGIGASFRFTSAITHTYLFNAPGVDGLVGNVFDVFKTALGLSDSAVVSNLHNIRGTSGLSVISGLGAQLAPITPIEIEAAPGLGLDNHAMYRLTDALAVYSSFNAVSWVNW